MLPKDPTKHEEYINKLRNKVFTPSHRRNLSLSQIGNQKAKGKKHSVPSHQKGIPLPIETKNKLSKSHIGKKHTEESKIKMSIKQLGISPWNKGKSTPEITRNKISQSKKNPSKETRLKISQSKIGNKFALGYKHTPEAIIKMRISSTGNKNWLGKTHSQESKMKMSIKAKARSKTKEFKDMILNSVRPHKDTKPERMMQLALALHGIKFEKHKPILGQPDIFIEPNICVFVDGDYIHGNPSKYMPDDTVCYHKIAKDVWAKDIKINHSLNELGYQVIRVWTSKILKDVNYCAENLIMLMKQLEKQKKDQTGLIKIAP